MKPSYFFLLDYYYEKKMSTGLDSDEAVTLETGGLAKFGQLELHLCRNHAPDKPGPRDT